MKVLVSACLLGEPVRYDGRASQTAAEARLQTWVEAGWVVPFCPECAGLLPTPRPPAEIQNGTGLDVIEGRSRVMTAADDVSTAFLRGAEAALRTCQRFGIRVAVLKERSPSCGSGKIYDGSFSGVLRDGDGVTTALLKSHGIQVFGESQVELAEAAIMELSLTHDQG